jgi:hypothetical protein
MGTVLFLPETGPVPDQLTNMIRTEPTDNKQGNKVTRHARRLLSLACLVLCFLPSPTEAQGAVGQYEQEAPLQSWNTFGFTTASGLAMGTARYAYAQDLSASTSNPALLTRLPEFSVVIGGSYRHATVFRYDLVNTGILMGEENGSINNYLLDFGGISANYKGWGLAFTVSLTELFDRPRTYFEYTFGGQIYYTLDFQQDGFIRTYNLGLSRQLGDSLSVGIALNYEKGSLERGYSESWLGPDINLSSMQKHEMQGFYLNGGVVYDPGQGFSAAAVFRTPYTRTADSESLVRNLTPPGGTDILIDSQGDSTFKRPFMLGGGVSYLAAENIRLAADLSFFNWSNYEVEHIGVPAARDFKNTISLNAGAEYNLHVVVFNHKIDIPLRMGFAYDPQPIREPGIKNYSMNLGFGLHSSHFFLDAGGSYIWESGSGDDLKYVHLAVSLGYKL